jgi:hypothetical protein
VTAALGAVLVVYAVSMRIYGDAHARVMDSAPSIPVRARWLISMRERRLVPGGLVSAGAALLAMAQGCHLAIVALVVTAALAALLDGGIAVALVAASRSTAPAVAETHRQAELGSRAEQGAAILRRLGEARREAEARSHRHHAEA